MSIKITASGLNSIRNSIYQVLGPVSTGYGAGLTSGDVSVGQTINTSSYYTVVDDLRRCWIHQKGSLDGFPSVGNLPKTGNTIPLSLLNTLTNLTANVTVNAYTTPPASQLAQNSLASSTSTIYNNNDLTYQVDYDFLNTADVNYFFNLGGRISAGLAHDNGTYVGNTAIWVNFIDWANEQIGSISYSRNQWSALTSVNARYTSGTNVVRLGIFAKDDRTICSALTVTNTIADLSISTTATSLLTYSTLGPVIDGKYRGVASPIPQASVVTSFGSGQTPPIIYTKRLTVSQPGSFTMPSDSNSNSQAVTITNTGNTATTITNIVFDEAFVPNYFITGLGGFTVPLLINPGSSFTFDLIYYLADNNYGFKLNTPYSINFSVYSDAIVNSITVNTQLTVVPPIFDFYLTPNPWNYTYLFRDGRIAAQSVIVGGKGDFTTITYGTDGNFSSRGFSIRDSLTVVGFDISFNPAGLSNGTYTTTVNITINGVTRPFTATIVLDVLPNVTRHLGNWVSALQNDNGIIGASYDIINGTKCITLGFGLGADGSNVVGNFSLGINVNIDNLGIGVNADNNYTLGPVLYPGPNTTRYNYSNFLKPYDANTNPDGKGAWVNDTGWHPNIFVSRTYTFNTTRTGLHSYRFAVDNQGYFTIDDNIIGDRRLIENTFSPVSDFFELNAGSHTLTIHVLNINNGYYDKVMNPGAFALEINDPAGITIWDTNFPIRRGYTAYQYWNEVYRIPLYDSTATDAVFYSKNYIIKNLNPLYGYSYGSAFGYTGFEQEGSMFRVFQDPYNNISILLIPKYREFDDKTTNYASHLFYYYTGVLGGDRLTQLESNRGDGQTLYFRGFDKNGTVTTSLLPQPGPPYIPPTEPINR
jgi:hypothetical protein